jgi:chemotaxis protein methyltransferase CheR
LTAITKVEIDRFASAITGRLGLALDIERGAAGISATLRDRLHATASSSVSEYLARLTPAEVGALAERLTVGETYFFRYREQFEALADVLPGLVERRGGARPLRILSAACSSGEEAGTIAIVARSALPHEIASASTILGVDVNPAAIRRAKRGRYSEWALRDTPEPVRARWFRPRGKEVELDGEARALLSFVEKNLADPDDELWRPEAYDVVFCRNALMYFAEDAAFAVIARIARALAPGGLLFLGPTETHLARADNLSVRRARGAFYHERVTRARRATPAAPPSPEPGPSAPVLLAPAPPDTWAEEISRAAERIAALLPPATAPSAPADPAPSSRRLGARVPIDLSRALDLLREDRIAEALEALPPDSNEDPEALLLVGVLLSSSGDVAGAERAGHAVLALDPLHAGARCLLALCREHEGDVDGAVEHDRVAVYLEPRFGMPHLHLGLLARRRGDQAEAARELSLAAALLAEDDADRILLFGGGLHREALIDRCRAELRASGVGA